MIVQCSGEREERGRVSPPELLGSETDTKQDLLRLQLLYSHSSLFQALHSTPLHSTSRSTHPQCKRQHQQPVSRSPGPVTEDVDHICEDSKLVLQLETQCAIRGFKNDYYISSTLVIIINEQHNILYCLPYTRCYVGSFLILSSRLYIDLKL